MTTAERYSPLSFNRICCIASFSWAAGILGKELPVRVVNRFYFSNYSKKFKEEGYDHKNFMGNGFQGSIRSGRYRK